MDRRSLMRMAGLAPVAAVASVLPAQAAVDDASSWSEVMIYPGRVAEFEIDASKFEIDFRAIDAEIEREFEKNNGDFYRSLMSRPPPGFQDGSGI